MTVWCPWFGVNICFSDEDQILIEHFYVFKGYGENNFIKKIPNKSWDCGH